MDTFNTQPINFPNENLKSIHESLLLGKKWRYLRYLHAREAILLASDIKTVLVIGAGHGLAELGLALEFPYIKFYLTDHAQATHSQLACRDRVTKWNINNVHFFELDILSPKPNIGNYDLVYSVEVLEHVYDTSKAVKNMIQIANKYIFCLVPFAESALNDDSFKREQALIRHGHHVVGYDSETLLALFPDPIEIRGCYWRDGGLILRNKLSSMSANEISLSLSELHEIAIKDLRSLVPSSTNEAQGIWVLSKLEKSKQGIKNYHEHSSSSDKNLAINNKRIFTKIYENNSWKSDESVSGPSSTYNRTSDIRTALPKFLLEHHVQILLDAPCGDFNWMREVVGLGVYNYIGCDIVNKLIEINNHKYSSDRITFKVLDIINDLLPTADLLLSRDFLFHLSYNDILKFLNNFLSSNIPLLLTTSHLNIKGFSNKDIKTGGWRWLDLFLPPFSFGDPKFIIKDGQDRALVLFTRDQVLSAYFLMKKSISKLDESCSSLNNFYLMRKGLIIKKDFLSAYSLEQSHINDFGLDEKLVISHAWTLNALKRYEECTTFLLKAALCFPNNETIIEKLKLHLSQKPCE